MKPRQLPPAIGLARAVWPKSSGRGKQDQLLKERLMPVIRDASIWIGETKQLKRLKIYVVGRRPAGKVSVWIEAGAGARRPPLPGFQHQESGFDSIEEAIGFSKMLFSSREIFEKFISNDLNALSLKRPDAPRLVQRVVPW